MFGSSRSKDTLEIVECLFAHAFEVPSSSTHVKSSKSR